MIESLMSGNVTCYLWGETDPIPPQAPFGELWRVTSSFLKRSAHTSILRGSWPFQDVILPAQKMDQDPRGLSQWPAQLPNWASMRNGSLTAWTGQHVQKLISTLIHWVIEHSWTSLLKPCLMSRYLYAKGSWKILGAVFWVYPWSSPGPVIKPRTDWPGHVKTFHLSVWELHKNTGSKKFAL